MLLLGAWRAWHRSGLSGRSTPWRSARPTACSRSAAATVSRSPWSAKRGRRRNDHRDRPLAQDDRDGHAEEPRSTSMRAGLCSRPSRWRTRTSAIGASTRSSLSTSPPSGSSRRRRSVPSASTSPGMGPSTSSGTRHSARGEPGTSETSCRPASRGRVLRRQGAGRGPAPGPRGSRDRAAPKADEHGPQHRVAFPCKRQPTAASERLLFLTASTSTSNPEPLTPRQTVEDRPPWT